MTMGYLFWIVLGIFCVLALCCYGNAKDGK